MTPGITVADSTVPTRYWHRLDDGRIQCDVCPRACKLREGQRGLCFVRAREGDAIVLTTYGRSSGFCVDPIEKKPLNHFLPGTPVLGRSGELAVGSGRHDHCKGSAGRPGLRRASVEHLRRLRTRWCDVQPLSR